MCLKESWPAELLLKGAKSGIEALDVSDLKRYVVLCGEADHFVCLGEGPRDGLLYQNVNSSRQAGAGRFVMIDCRGRDAYRLDLVEDLTIVTDIANAKLVSDRAASRFVCIADGDQFTSFERGHEPRVFAPEVAYANDGCPDLVYHRFVSALILPEFLFESSVFVSLTAI
jgi:hypothetical protein